MQNILRNTTAGDRSATPWILLLILCGYVLAALFLFQLVAYVAILPFFDFDFERSLAELANPYGSDTARLPLMILQGVTSLGMFILMPYFFIRKHLNLGFAEFFPFSGNIKQPVFMTVIILFCFMVANSIIIEWNQSVELPGFLSYFEEWAQSKEAQLEKLTKYLTEFQGVHEFLIAMIVIAIIPAIGEELLFRGLIQNLFGSAFKNPHVAIWTAAILFGVFHMQFYGVVPRTLLGALFGYLYYWSGHLTIAMVGHFVNNGFTLTILYLGQLNVMEFDPTSAETSPPMYIILIFFTIGSVLLYLFRNYFKTRTNA